MRKRQPNSRHCFVCGVENPIGLKLRFDKSANGEVVAECVLGEEYQGYPGVVHGGIVAAMLDEMAGRTQMGGNPPRFLYTAKMEIRYRQNVPIGQRLRLVGKSGKSRRRMATASSAIFDQNDNVLAEADVLLVDVPEQIIESVDLEELGWKVYED